MVAGATGQINLIPHTTIMKFLQQGVAKIKCPMVPANHY